MRFKRDKCGAVLDLRTGLMWSPHTYGERLDWYSALDLCKNMDFLGYNDWRLPTVQELHSIVDHERFQPAIDIVYFSDTVPHCYWASSEFVEDANYAWAICFRFGNSDWGFKTNLHHIRFVRDGGLS